MPRIGLDVEATDPVPTDDPDLDTTAITVTVTDNGPGISAEMINKVLDFRNLFSDKACTGARPAASRATHSRRSSGSRRCSAAIPRHRIPGREA